jgi:hypothetical protein
MGPYHRYEENNSTTHRCETKRIDLLTTESFYELMRYFCAIVVAYDAAELPAVMTIAANDGTNNTQVGPHPTSTSQHNYDSPN